MSLEEFLVRYNIPMEETDTLVDLVMDYNRRRREWPFTVNILKKLTTPQIVSIARYEEIDIDESEKKDVLIQKMSSFSGSSTTVLLEKTTLGKPVYFDSSQDTIPLPLVSEVFALKQRKNKFTVTSAVTFVQQQFKRYYSEYKNMYFKNKVLYVYDTEWRETLIDDIVEQYMIELQSACDDIDNDKATKVLRDLFDDDALILKCRRQLGTYALKLIKMYTQK